MQQQGKERIINPAPPPGRARLASSGNTRFVAPLTKDNKKKTFHVMHTQAGRAVWQFSVKKRVGSKTRG